MLFYTGHAIGQTQHEYIICRIAAMPVQYPVYLRSLPYFYFITSPYFFLHISINHSTYPMVYTAYSEKFRIRFIATTFWILFRANRHLLSSPAFCFPLLPEFLWLRSARADYSCSLSPGHPQSPLDKQLHLKNLLLFFYKSLDLCTICSLSLRCKKWRS